MSTIARPSSRPFDGDAARGGVHAAAGAPGTAPVGDDENALFSIVSLRELAGFPFRALRRHVLLAAATFVGLGGMALAVAFLAPRHYRVEAKLIADRNSMISNIGNPQRSIPTESETPTRLAAEAVKKRENVDRIIGETKLLSLWPKMRSPAGRVKDFALAVVNRSTPEAERMKALVGFLSQRLSVKTEEGTVTIGVDWPEPKTAYAIVTAAERNFVEERHNSEVAMIQESISILEGHLASAQASIDQSLTAIRRARGNAPQGISTQAIIAAIGRTTPRRRPTGSLEADALQASLAAKQQTIAQLEALRAQRMATVQGRLEELRNTYGPAHPEISTLEDNLKALSSPLPQLEDLRREAEGLRTRLSAMGITAVEPLPVETRDDGATRALLERLATVRPDSGEDPELTYAQSKLKIATSDYESLLDRLEGARIELETARAAFKYRFETVLPPELPKKANSPNVPLIAVGGVVFAAVLAVFAVIGIELIDGRLREPWQVRMLVGLPVVARVRTP